MKNPRRIVIAVILLITIVNYNRIAKIENIRTIQFLYIFVMGALSSLLINEFVVLFKAKRKE
ncbi:hypothetical protein [uncultured Mucilaginibacter sp.]|uniref:hypothetical protein n=1 Tax=uncultured Mucilaginibacter sp. TaxID=797541 RepID=UPI0026111ABF|nr:hypothetical protein [uncultured Mucilaginibacter sp.]